MNTVQDLKHTISSLKHGGGGVSSKMNSEVYRHILSAQGNASKLIGQWLILQQDNDPKHTPKATKEFLKAKKW